ncbi:hypothetical protein C8J56DRAFT_785716, partial [Mycena floridula]
ICCKGVFTSKAQALVHMPIKHGCLQAKVGVTIRDLGKLFGADFGPAMSHSTVQHIIMEGMVAAKVQLGFEIARYTLSADSTSHLKFNYEGHHGAFRVPNYNAKGDVLAGIETSKPKVCFISLQSSVDHSSKTSKAAWMKDFDSVVDLFNKSPLAKHQKLKLSLRDFARKLCGMMGDHANNEKKTASLLEQWKKEEAVKEAGERSLAWQDIVEVLNTISEC